MTELMNDPFKQGTPYSRKDFNPLDPSLPDELKAQVKPEESKEALIIDVFRIGGGTLNLSELLIGLYKVYNIIAKRSWLTVKLHKMKNKGLVSATGRKGEFALREAGSFKAPEREE